MRPGSATSVGQADLPTGKAFVTWARRRPIPPAIQLVLRGIEWMRRTERLPVVEPSITGNRHLLEVLGNAAFDGSLTVARSSIETMGRLVTRPRADDTADTRPGPGR